MSPRDWRMRIQDITDSIILDSLFNLIDLRLDF